MTKGQFFLLGVSILVLLVAVGLLIAASAQGMTIVEMFRSWVEKKPETPTPEVVEGAKIVKNLLRI